MISSSLSGSLWCLEGLLRILLSPVDFLLVGATPGGGGGGALVCDGGPLEGADPGIGGTRLILLVKLPGVVGDVGEGKSDPK